jgi:hypothetical protein
MMELSLRYDNALLAPRSGGRETTGYLLNTATTLLSTKKIVSPQRLEQADFLVVAQPLSAADAPQLKRWPKLNWLLKTKLERQKMRQL